MTKPSEVPFNQVRNSDLRLIIALDHGTTFASITYVSREQNKPDLEAVVDWPGPKVPKMPSIIDFDVLDRQLLVWELEVVLASMGKPGAEHRVRQNIESGGHINSGHIF
jgi:hypothetical protein